MKGRLGIRLALRPDAIGDEWQRRAATYEREARRIDALAEVVPVSLAPTHTCVVTRQQHALYFGSNDCGERGDGSLIASASPTYVVHFASTRVRLRVPVSNRA